ncbi:MAG TPA: MBG domain-containing protein, partial [Sphingomonas sp.]|nr:MBG domain-containing protein [Sphingomonas sp.]
ILSNVGGYAINVDSASLSGPAAGNYTINSVAGTLTITPAPLLVTGDHLTRVFGDPDPLLTFRVEGLRNADTASSVLTGRLRRVPGEDVGIYPVLRGSLTLASPNYVLTYVNGSLTITPASLIVRADPNEKFFGAPDPLLTWQVEGLRLGDTIDIITGQVVRDPGEDVGTFTIRQGTIAITSPNYVLDFVEAPFVIRPRIGDLGMLVSRAFDPWRIHRIERGRDPDTPGDAVYRTTPYENPYIPDPLMRAYALGHVQFGDADPIDWRNIDNDRTGQHADRPRAQPPCPSSELQTVMLCRADGFLRDFWTVVK